MRIRRHHAVPEGARLLDRAADRALAHLGFPVLLGHELPVAFAVKVLQAGVAAARRPSVDVRAAPAGVDKADRDVKRVGELQRVVVAHRGRLARHLLDRLRRHRGPLRLHVELRLGRHHVLRLHETHPRLHGHRDVHRALAVAVARTTAPDRAVRVGLTAAEPHLAHEDVLQLRVVGRERAALLGGGHRAQLDHPLAAGTGLRAAGLAERGAGEGHLHRLAGIRRAPHAHGHVALQHHLVAEHRGERHLGLRRPHGRQRGHHEQFLHLSLLGFICP